MADAYLTVAGKTEAGCRIYNVGPEREGIKTAGEIAAYVSDIYGIEYDKEKAGDIGVKEKAYLGLSIEKIKSDVEPGWKPKRTLEQTLNEIYEFYSQDDGVHTYDLCMSQIKNYYNEEVLHE